MDKKAKKRLEVIRQKVQTLQQKLSGAKGAIWLGFDPLWFCILLVVILQTSLLTPPMAGTIFYLRAVAPPEIKLHHMYRGVIPFIGLHFVVLAAIMAFPQMALWLPEVLIGFD